MNTVDNGFMEWLRKRCEILPDGVTVEDVADQTFIFEFSAFDLREAWIAAKAEGMEEAAKLCDPPNPPHDWTEYAKIKAACADTIRTAAAKLLES